MSKWIKGMVATLLIGAAALTAYAGPTITIGKQVTAAGRTPAERIDHSPWNALLKKYADARGMVDYRRFKASPGDLQALDNYLNHLSTASFTAQTDARVKLAYWVNAYNAVTVKGILREYPTTSIRNHTAKVFGYNIWDDLQLVVSGKQYSLNQMEHEVLRKMGEPRIHFAIVCASIGCPRLLREAYLPDKLEEQLATNTRAFFADRGKFEFDTVQRTISVSPILKWFGEDFGKTSADQMRRIAPWLPQAAQELANSGNARVSYLGYDWGLNDQAQVGRLSSRRQP